LGKAYWYVAVWRRIHQSELVAGPTDNWYFSVWWIASSSEIGIHFVKISRQPIPKGKEATLGALRHDDHLPSQRSRSRPRALA